MPERRRLDPRPTNEKGWSRAETLQPQCTERLPTEISDGGGIAFAPAALTGATEPLDPHDPAVALLIEQLDVSAGGVGLRRPWRREQRDDSELAARLAGWRLLASTPDRRLFCAGLPPQLVTVSLQRRRGGRWTIVAVSRSRPIRAARGPLRASSFRVDPDTPVRAEDRVLRLLVVEQTRAGGRLAHGRFQTPDLYLDEQELLLRMFITPLEGWQAGTRRWETPVLVELPEPVGNRRVVDGAVFWEPAVSAAH